MFKETKYINEFKAELLSDSRCWICWLGHYIIKTWRSWSHESQKSDLLQSNIPRDKICIKKTVKLCVKQNFFPHTLQPLTLCTTSLHMGTRCCTPSISRFLYGASLNDAIWYKANPKPPYEQQWCQLHTTV